MSFNVTQVAGGRLDFPFFPTKQYPYVKGLAVETYSTGDIESSLSFDFDAELVSVGIACSNYSVGDSWSLFVGDRIVAEDIYTKDLPEGIYLMAVIPVPAGTEVTVQYHNEAGDPKVAWFTFHFFINKILEREQEE